MKNYYIKEGGEWFGPMSVNEFEARKRDKDQIEYWKPEFCVNRVLHPQLCDHSKTWVKPPPIAEKPVEPEQTLKTPEEPLKKQVILHAEPLDIKEEKVISSEDQKKSDNIPEKTMPTKTEDNIKQTEIIDKPGKASGFTFKLSIIIIGFILVFGAGFYANSKLSVMFYQDIIIQESLKNIEYYTRDMVNETKEVKTDIDSLNAVMTREVKALKKQMKEMESELIKLKYGQ